MSAKIFSFNPVQIIQQRKNQNENLVSNFNTIFDFQSNHQNLPHKLMAKTSHWTNIEKSKYLIFICYFRDFFGLRREKQLEWSLFRCMGKFIQTRSPQQCRSHHLKLLKIYKTVEGFIFKALRKFPMLSEKFIEVQERLNKLQQEFNLFSVRKSKSQNEQILKNGFINIKAQMINSHLNIKGDKLGMMKTSDEYFEGEKFVKNTPYISFDNIGRASSKRKSQLPNFDEQNQSSSMEEKIQPRRNVQNQHKCLQSAFQCQNQNIGFQRIKDIQQCQYLYQLWSKKLEQIMTGSAIYNIKSCDQE